MSDDDKEREQLVSEIEMLYPPDGTAEGVTDLVDSLCYVWRDFPLPVLRQLRHFNVARDRGQR